MSKPSMAAQIKQTAALRTPLIRDISASALLLLITRASILNTFPFGIAFFAACFDINAAYLGVAVMFAGLSLANAGIAVVKYIIAALLFWLFDRLKPDRLSGTVISAAACGISVCLGGIFMLAADFGGIYDVLMLLTEGIISAFMYIIFKKADGLVKTRKKRRQASKDEIVSLAVTVGVVITGMSDIILPGNISISNIASFYAVMSIAANATLSAAGSGGLCIGFIGAMNGDSAMLMMGVMGAAGLFSNLLKAFGRFGVIIGTIGAAAVSVLYCGHSFTLPFSIWEVGLAAMLFLITPPKIYNFISVFFSNTLTIENVSADTRVKEYAVLRLKNTSDVFSKLYECFFKASDKRLKLYSKEIDSMLDEVARRVCAGCQKAGKCWHSDFAKTYKIMTNMLSSVENDGILLNPPEELAKKCSMPDSLVMEFNHVYEIYKSNMIRSGEAIEARDLIAAQYSEISKIMDRLSSEIGNGFEFREDLEEAIVSELDKYGIRVFEISVIEEASGRLELYCGMTAGSDIAHAERIMTDVVGSPIGFDKKEKNGILKFISKPRYTVDYAIKQIPRDTSRVSGDSAAAFKTDDYRMYFIISDGMGSGIKAQSESKITVNLLREFLTAGFGIKTAIDLINSSLCLKLDNECFATIDLLSVDLMTGYAEFYKVGSAQSFVYTKDGVDTVFSASIPAGMLKSVKTDGHLKHLEEGDTILMVSDGITEAGFTAVRTEWLKKEITGLYDSMEDMSDNIIHTAVRKGRDIVTDDMSVIAIRLFEA